MQGGLQRSWLQGLPEGIVCRAAATKLGEERLAAGDCLQGLSAGLAAVTVAAGDCL